MRIRGSAATFKLASRIARCDWSGVVAALRSSPTTADISVVVSAYQELQLTIGGLELYVNRAKFFAAYYQGLVIADLMLANFLKALTGIDSLAFCANWLIDRADTATVIECISSPQPVALICGYPEEGAFYLTIQEANEPREEFLHIARNGLLNRIVSMTFPEDEGLLWFCPSGVLGAPDCEEIYRPSIEDLEYNLSDCLTVREYSDGFENFANSMIALCDVKLKGRGCYCPCCATATFKKWGIDCAEMKRLRKPWIHLIWAFGKLEEPIRRCFAALNAYPRELQKTAKTVRRSRSM